MNKIEVFSLEEARRLVLRAQMLDGSGALPRGKEGAARVIERLGYVQIDTIAVVERAHHQVLWTRCTDYKPAFLDRLLSQERRIFEYWGHAAAYLPMCDYRFYLARMQGFPWNHSWFLQFYREHKNLMDEVWRRVEREGPLGASDFQAPPGKKRGSWWDWKPAKAALELLFWQGKLMVTARRNFQRIYDLTERVLPMDLDLTPPDPHERACFFVRRCLQAHGLATWLEIKAHLLFCGDGATEGALREMADSGEVTEARVEKAGAKGFYALAEFLEPPPKAGMSRRLHLLSPFDNLVIQRRRLKSLFGFNYQIECYIPQAKRKYGYFALPILWGSEFAGRIDVKADRQAKVLRVPNLVLEENFSVDDPFRSVLALKLVKFARFNGCDRIKIVRSSPRELRAGLQKTIDPLF